MLTEAMPKGWVGWAQQATELHTFCADHENGTKAEHGFFNLCHKSIAAVREDLVTDYQALADQHSEEIAHILEEYGTAELEIAHQLHKDEAERLTTGQQTIEIVEPTMKETPDSEPIPILDATAVDTPLPPTLDTPPQAEPTATREPPAHPELTSKPATTPHADPTPEPEPSEPLHTNKTTRAVEIETPAPDPPPVTTPPIDPTPPEPGILDILEDA